MVRLEWRSVLAGAGLLLAVVGLGRSVRCGAQPYRPEHAVVVRELNLRGFQAVPGSAVFRADLMDSLGGYSSSGRVRNILFVEPSGESRWLLPDDDHVVEEERIAAPRKDEPRDPDSLRQAIANVALVRPLERPEAGSLVLFDPTGRRVETIASDVRDVHGTALTPEGLAILYDHAGTYVLAHYEPSTLAKLREVRVAVSGLK